ncbi:MAG: N-acetyltransferase family protein [Bosea sp. (in: a-proteobacteria)]|uniref:GNAT family N-acetyltransferase n=1 Tax=Bosea sp. (in: a-proteobacteria) TaxID=1871050 RepID=UPI0027329336|nr:GNAT family N-acetyltransferase [Bosea sp. (in: a-proteobacteria)]MDP3257065.1 N-acetyltransferase family protein [Bosea sp. (in: a-proteobacteria)]MDP3321359.1 N-acetyltransferase family protein [Bosea sp. (in: a-proteobacteria)]
MTAPAIRHATPADIRDITAIYAHAVRHGTASWELEPPDAAEMQRRFEAVTAGGYPYLVAERDGRLLGYAYASAYRPRPAYRTTVENSIYIAPDAQGAGSGSALLAALMEACANRGFRQMIAVIGDGTGGSIGSRRLHERARFRLIGVAEKVGFKHGRWLDQMLMQKELGEGDRTPPA